MPLKLIGMNNMFFPGLNSTKRSYGTPVLPFYHFFTHKMFLRNIALLYTQNAVKYLSMLVNKDIPKAHSVYLCSKEYVRY